MYLPLLLVSIVTNFFLSNILIERFSKQKPRRGVFYLGLFFNLSLLGFFKYYDFFIENINAGLSSAFPILNIALPLAISFFTLQQIAYLVDAFEGGMDKKSQFFPYCLFVSFFPQLIAGPIVHHKEMMPQFSERSIKFNYSSFAKGLLFFSVGLFKKIAIADLFSPWVEKGFNNAEFLTPAEAWITGLAYTFQLYFDFSGYTNMARGIGFMFNIDLPINFNSPLSSRNVTIFWKRWHISLTKFITTYVFMPFLRLFKEISFIKILSATTFSMFVSGVWHGAGWTYILFGLMHGLGLVSNHITKKLKLSLAKPLAISLNFIFILITFVMFRAQGLENAKQMYLSMLGLNDSSFFEASNIHLNMTRILALCMACFVIIFFSNNLNKMKIQLNVKTLLWAVFCIMGGLLYMGRHSEFLYFQF